MGGARLEQSVLAKRDVPSFADDQMVEQRDPQQLAGILQATSQTDVVL